MIRQKLSAKLMGVAPRLAFLIYPNRSLSVEISSACNIQCLCCPVGQKLIPAQNMSPEGFAEILDLLPSRMRSLDFSHRGDPTMNPDLSKIIRMAYEKGFRTDVYTNGLALDRHLPQLVESGLSSIRIDLDGATEESYLRYRVGSDYQKVKENIRSLVETRAKTKSRFPERIAILCVVSSFNEHEIPGMQDLARDLGVDEILFKSVIANYGTKYYNDPTSQNDVIPKNPAYRRSPRPKDFLCPFLWRGAILVNGDFLVCSCDFEGELVLGNLLKERNFDKVFFSEKARAIRRSVVDQTVKICQSCPVSGFNHYLKGISLKFKNQAVK